MINCVHHVGSRTTQQALLQMWEAFRANSQQVKCDVGSLSRCSCRLCLMDLRFHKTRRGQKKKLNVFENDFKTFVVLVADSRDAFSARKAQLSLVFVAQSGEEWKLFYFRTNGKIYMNWVHSKAQFILEVN